MHVSGGFLFLQGSIVNQIQPICRLPIRLPGEPRILGNRIRQTGGYSISITRTNKEAEVPFKPNSQTLKGHHYGTANDIQHSFLAKEK
jgi:hypothetical protein